MAGFGRLEQGRRARALSDINVTPLIDVMLVLLVIFIVTAPLLTSRLALDLPRAEGARPGAAPAFLALALDAQGQLFLAEQPLARAQLEERVREAARDQPELEVQLRVDRRVPYGEVAELIGVVQAAGLSRIGFVTEGPAPSPAPAAAPSRQGPTPRIGG
jgi:biopolymer transport protein ExbD